MIFESLCMSLFFFLFFNITVLKDIIMFFLLLFYLLVYSFVPFDFLKGNFDIYVFLYESFFSFLLKGGGVLRGDYEENQMYLTYCIGITF